MCLTKQVIKFRSRDIHTFANVWKEKIATFKTISETSIKSNLLIWNEDLLRFF